MTHSSDPLQAIVDQFRQDWQPPESPGASPTPAIEDILASHADLLAEQPGRRDELLRRLLQVEHQLHKEGDLTFVPDDYHQRFPDDADLVNELSGEARWVPLRNTLLGDYILKESVGAGAMGGVWKAEHRTTGLEVALKFPQSEKLTPKKLLELFLDETRHQVNLAHPHILPVLEVGPSSLDRRLSLDTLLESLGGRPAFAVYELIPGGWTLQMRLGQGRVQHLPRFLHRLVEVCSALEYIHSRDEPVYHLDLKPANILLRDSDLESEAALVADFGLSARGQPTQAGGTLPYMPPERLKARTGFDSDGDLTKPGAADVWAVGVMLYEGLTGRKPFASKSLILRDEFTPQPIRELSDHVPAELVALTDQCLSRDPSARPPAHEVRERLQQVHHQLPPLPDWSRPDVITAPPAEGSTQPHSPIPSPDESDTTASESSGTGHSAASVSRAADVFVGRDDELSQIERGLLQSGTSGRSVAIVAVQGLAGIGKTYLAERFLHLFADRFTGEPVRLVLPRGEDRSTDQLRDELLDRLNVPAAGDVWAALRSGLSDRVLLIENVDTSPLAAAVSGLARNLAGCPLLVTGRSAQLGEDAGWTPVRVPVLSPEESAEQLREEIGPSRFERLSDQDRSDVIERLAGLPQAVHLAAGYLRSGYPVERFLERLSRQRLGLPLHDVSDPAHGEAVLHAAFETSLDTLRAALANLAGDDAEVDGLILGFRRLGHGPLSGMGRSLAGAVSGLEPGELADVLLEALALSLLDSDDAERFKLHPLLAEWLAEPVDADSAAERMTDWFVPRLRSAEPGRMTAPGEELDEAAEQQVVVLRTDLHAEYAALPHWLPRVPDVRMREVEHAGSTFAICSGPFLAWRRFCEHGLDTLDRGLAAPAVDSSSVSPNAVRSNFLWTLGRVCLLGGDPDAALAAARRKQTLDTDRDAPYGAALAASLIADVLQVQGELDEALRIRREEQLPVYERLGDVRAKAVTQGKIADVLQARGELDEALRIRREEELPVYERLGDVRAKAVTARKIADILASRGDLDEALRIYREEALAPIRGMGLVADEAVFQGFIADVLQARGDLDEALRIRREEQLPVYERLGATRDLLVGQAKLALILLERNTPGDRDEAAELLRQAHAAAERMGIPEADQIRQIQDREGF